MSRLALPDQMVGEGVFVMIRTIPLPSGLRLITDDQGNYEVWHGTWRVGLLRFPALSEADLAVILTDRETQLRVYVG